MKINAAEFLVLEYFRKDCINIMVDVCDLRYFPATGVAVVVVAVVVVVVVVEV